MWTSPDAWRSRRRYVAMAAVVVVIGMLGTASRPQAIAGTLPTPADWVSRSDASGAIRYSVPPSWQTVSRPETAPGFSMLDAALEPDQAEFRGSVTGLLLEPGAGPAVSVSVNRDLVTDLGITPEASLGDTVDELARWANRGWTSIFVEQRCDDAGPRPFVGVGLRGLAWDFRNCHGSTGSVRTFVAVDEGRHVLVIGWYLARTDRDRPVLDAMLGSLRVSGSALG